MQEKRGMLRNYLCNQFQQNGVVQRKRKHIYKRALLDTSLHLEKAKFTSTTSPSIFNHFIFLFFKCDGNFQTQLGIFFFNVPNKFAFYFQGWSKFMLATSPSNFYSYVFLNERGIFQTNLGVFFFCLFFIMCHIRLLFFFQRWSKLMLDTPPSIYNHFLFLFFFLFKCDRNFQTYLGVFFSMSHMFAFISKEDTNSCWAPPHQIFTFPFF